MLGKHPRISYIIINMFPMMYCSLHVFNLHLFSSRAFCELYSLLSRPTNEKE